MRFSVVTCLAIIFFSFKGSGQTVDTVRIDSITLAVTKVDQSGTEITRERYRNGRLHGLTTQNHYDGRKERLLYFGHYNMGKREGLHSSFWANGQLKYEISYGADLRNGSTIKYWSNGNRSLVENYCHGKQCGEWRFYDKKGMLYLIEFYYNGIYGGGVFFDRDLKMVAKVMSDDNGKPIRKTYYNSSGEEISVITSVPKEQLRKLN